MHSDSTRVRVWDLPTRLFHVFLILCFAGLITTGQMGGDDWMVWHFYLGYATFSLVLFRIVWGFCGGYWSRFAHFLPTPSLVKGYWLALRLGQHPRFVSHNPLGALSVLSMLVLLLAQVFSGLMADDEVSVSGPWSSWAPNQWVEWASEYHTEVGQFLLIGLVALHIVSVLVHRFAKNDDLISPMKHGDKALPANTRASADTWRTRCLALLIWLACAFAVYLCVRLSPL